MEESIWWIIGSGIILVFILVTPFFFNQLTGMESGPDGGALLEKEFIFSQLSELEYDYLMGKMSEEDYKRTRSELTMKAVKHIGLTDEVIEKVKEETEEEIEEVVLSVNNGNEWRGDDEG